VDPDDRALSARHAGCPKASMRMRLLVPVLLLSAACTSMGEQRARRGMAGAKEREAFLPMIPEEQAREAMPPFGGRAIPHLARVAAWMPKTWAAEMAAWGALGKEGTLDRKLLSQVFYVVSSSNDCFY
jgi:alkylhydroperoxidase family enzyme